uniref:Neur_chan_LBD domain-containing protein n=1 Tax=Toxocara canis TaxID=6265 RepID=A0A183TXX7_TOXCA
LVWVDSDGRVFYDCRISLVVICIMDLWKYPLDSQVCEMRILSYAYPESQLRLKWSDRIRPIDRNMDIRMPDMQLIDIRTGTCNGTYATGIWSCMTAIFIVEREMMHHVMQTYLPSALIVVISWFNFWLDVDSAPARVSLSITTLLTISTQANAVKLALPEVSYMKAIDVWMGSCMAFVFGVMIEFTICHFAKNRELSRSDLRPTIVDSVVNTLFVGNQDIVDVVCLHFAPTVVRNKEERLNSKFPRQLIQVTRRALAWTRSLRNLRGRRVANKIDEKCRFIFPISFVVFNILYWSFYILLN